MRIDFPDRAVQEVCRRTAGFSFVPPRTVTFSSPKPLQTARPRVFRTFPFPRRKTLVRRTVIPAVKQERKTTMQRVQQLAERLEKADVVLVDVAGTTSSIGILKTTLFSYVIDNVESFLKEKWDDATVQDVVKGLKEADGALLKGGNKDEEVAAIASFVKAKTEENSSLEPFKKLQGIVSKSGYESGSLKGHVFKDVAETFAVWSKTRRICVYSTGSIESQRLLFQCSVEGDLSGHIARYFDLEVGSKTEMGSYKKIAEELAVQPGNVIFLTDSVDEAKAASEAGINVALVSREGNAELSEDARKTYPVITSFAELQLDGSGKRKIGDGADAETEGPPEKILKTDSAEETPAETSLPVDAKAKNEPESMEVDSVDACVADPNAKASEHTAEEIKEKKTEEVVPESTDKATDVTPKPEEATTNDTSEPSSKEIEAKETAETTEKPVETVSAVPEKTTMEVDPEKTDKTEPTGVDVCKENKTEQVVEPKTNGVDSAEAEAKDLKENEEKTEDTKSESKAEGAQMETEEIAEVKTMKSAVETVDKINTNETEKDNLVEEVVVVKDQVVDKAENVEEKNDSVESKESDVVPKEVNSDETNEVKKDEVSEANPEVSEAKPEVSETKIEASETKIEVSETQAEVAQSCETKDSEKEEAKPETETNHESKTDEAAHSETAEPIETETKGSDEPEKTETPDVPEVVNGVENGDAEKENKPDIANGAVGNGEPAEDADSEIKVKKIEEAPPEADKSISLEA